MSRGSLDGAVFSQSGREWIMHEEQDDDGRWYGWSECGDCGETVPMGDDARQDHDCQECPGCGDRYSQLPVVDGVNGQGYCTGDCHDEASERYWTAVWAS